jgi:hypothetical protein
MGSMGSMGGVLLLFSGWVIGAHHTLFRQLLSEDVGQDEIVDSHAAHRPDATHEAIVRGDGELVGRHGRHGGARWIW